MLGGTQVKIKFNSVRRECLSKWNWAEKKPSSPRHELAISGKKIEVIIISDAEPFCDDVCLLEGPSVGENNCSTKWFITAGRFIYASLIFAPENPGRNRVRGHLTAEIKCLQNEITWSQRQTETEARHVSVLAGCTPPLRQRAHDLIWFTALRGHKRLEIQWFTGLAMVIPYKFRKWPIWFLRVFNRCSACMVFAHFCGCFPICWVTNTGCTLTGNIMAKPVSFRLSRAREIVAAAWPRGWAPRERDVKERHCSCKTGTQCIVVRE